jgi:hypothetical protein
MLFQGEVNSNTLILVGVAEAGIPIFDIKLAGQGMTFTPRIKRALPVHPKQILEAFQLAFWPETVVAAGLKPYCSLISKPQQRYIKCDGVYGLKIDYRFDNGRLKSVQYRPENSSWLIDIIVLN